MKELDVAIDRIAESLEECQGQVREVEQLTNGIPTGMNERSVVCDWQFKYRRSDTFLEELTAPGAEEALKKSVSDPCKHHVEALALELSINTSVADLCRLIISSAASTQEVSALVLEHAQRLTESAFGFVSFIEQKTGHSISAAMTADDGSLCRLEGKQMDAEGLRGLWRWVLENHGEVFESRKPLFINSPAGNLHSTKISSGHIRIRRFLFVPALIGERLVARIVLANSEHDYTERDVVVTERLATIYAIALQRSQEEERLRRSEERYRNLVESARDTILTISAHGDITSLNPAFEAMTGWRCADWLGKRFISLLDPEDGYLGEEMLQRILQGETVPHFEVHIGSSQGGYLTVEFAASPQVVDGQVEGMFGIVRDITENKAAREECNRLATVVKEMGEGIVITDCNGVIEYVNPAFESTTGYERTEIVGCHYNILSHNDQNDHGCACLDTGQWDIAIQGAVCDIQRTNRRKDGTPYEVKTTISPIRDTSGKIISYALIERDITHLLKLETRLRQAHKMEAIGTLSGGIAHDFNNILTPITGYTQLAISDVEDGKLPELRQLEEVLKAARRARNLVKQILTISRQTEQESRPIRISSIIKETMEFLRASLPSTIEIQQDIGTESRVMGDPTQIHQVVMNLCTNAGHSMRERGGILRISLSETHFDSKVAARYHHLQPGHYLRLTVSDTGPGIDPSIIEKIFDPFFTTKEPGEGTGLGLAVVHGIIRNHGGIISVQSEPGEGATFKIHLPTVDAEEREIVEIRAVTRGNERILYIDDEPPIAQLGQKMLEHIGYQVVSRTNSIEALKTFRAGCRGKRFDLVITDMTMPGMTGIELARQLLSIQRDIPIILCTGFSEMISHEEAGRLGIREFLMKPLMMRELAAAVRKALDADKSSA